LQQEKNISNHENDENFVRPEVTFSSESLIAYKQEDGNSEDEESTDNFHSKKPRQQSVTRSLSQPTHVNLLRSDIPNAVPNQVPASAGITPPLVLNQSTSSQTSSFLSPWQYVQIVSPIVGPGIFLQPTVTPNKNLNIVPHAVALIHNMILQCNYGLESAPLLQKHSTMQKSTLPNKSKAQEQDKSQQDKAKPTLKNGSKPTSESNSTSSNFSEQTEKLRSALNF